MKHKPLLLSLGAMVLFGTVVQAAYGQEPGVKKADPTNTASAISNESKPDGRTASPIHPLFIDVMKARGLKPAGSNLAVTNPSKTMVTPGAGGSSQPASASSSFAPLAFDSQDGNDRSGVGPTLPLWTFRVHSSRDGNSYSGAMVGKNPFRDPGKTKVSTKVIPLIIKTQLVATSFDPKTGNLGTAPGNTAFDPTSPDSTNPCLSAPNNVATHLVSQSPIFTPTKFVFGATNVGTTTYNDAFQRANFWNILGEDRDSYHVLLDPVQVLDPITLEVPDVYGVAIANLLLLGPPAFCAPLGIVDINWFDTYLTGTVVPALAKENNLDPTNLPIFLVYNVVWASPANSLAGCCALGYHGTTGFPIPTQTYSPAEFDTTGVFTSDGSILDTEVLSHEIDEWMNDPMISNPTPPWGHTGQVSGCQANLEVGDPLSGTDMPLVTMPNGFKYHLQELAFFSWFFGAPSIGVNGWFSDNGTFLTDAGAPCH
jgi:hypothetical protein